MCVFVLYAQPERNNKRAVKTASDTQVRNKIYENSINAWKNYKKYLNKDFVKLKY